MFFRKRWRFRQLYKAASERLLRDRCIADISGTMTHPVKIAPLCLQCDNVNFDVGNHHIVQLLKIAAGGDTYFLALASMYSNVKCVRAYQQRVKMSVTSPRP